MRGGEEAHLGWDEGEDGEGAEEGRERLKESDGWITLVLAIFGLDVKIVVVWGLYY